MKLIVNADDFGLSRGTNYGIFDAHIRGIVTSTTLMVTMQEVDHAIELSKQAPDLRIGLHLNITLGRPLTHCPSLIKNGGMFHKPAELPDQAKFKENEIYEEFKAQYHRFVEKLGKEPSHFDSHLYAHQKYEVAQKALIKLASEVNLPVRDVQINSFNPVVFEDWFKLTNGDNLEDKMRKHIPKMVEHEICELMVHPAYLDPFLMEQSGYNVPRVEELKILTSSAFRELLKKNKIELVTYEDDAVRNTYVKN